MSPSLAKLASTIVRFQYLAVLLLLSCRVYMRRKTFALALNGLRRVLRLTAESEATYM